MTIWGEYRTSIHLKEKESEFKLNLEGIFEYLGLYKVIQKRKQWRSGWEQMFWAMKNTQAKYICDFSDIASLVM